MIEKDIPEYYINVLKEIEQYIPTYASDKVHITPKQIFPDMKPEYATSNEYLFELINSSGPWHSGMPGYMKSKDWNEGYLHRDPDNTVITILKLIKKLGKMLMCRRSTLITCYPPGGYIGWHHNGNVPGRNILFSWSETGDGVFRLYNNKLKNFEEYPDSPGWNVKSMRFYSHLEAEETGYSWHSMSTNCLRFSIGFLLTDDEYTDRPEVMDVLQEDVGLVNKSLNGAWF